MSATPLNLPSAGAWSWQKALLKKCRSPLDVLQKFETIIDLADVDVQKILFTTNYAWIAKSDNYYQFYRNACTSILQKIEKIKNGAFLKCKTPRDALKWLIARIANEVKNFFDRRVKSSVQADAASPRNIDDIDICSKNNFFEELKKIDKKELIFGLKKMWSEDFKIDDIEHLCARFKIAKSAIFGDFEDRKFMRKNEKNQLFFEFA
ncbi:hypothetical protein [Sulfurospirillum sp. 1612]|uniref:hypothetical protein n=1 Tax=Sulfurospirillum sp. 1612 TaxID=3094835 RepID=UPI002F924528